MPICTYLEENQHRSLTNDSELNRLLIDVRIATGRDWRLRETITLRRRWFRKPVEVRRYTLYLHTTGAEFQIMNFYRPENGSEWLPSINTMNDAGYIAAYFYGLLAGTDGEASRLRTALQGIVDDDAAGVSLEDQRSRWNVRIEAARAALGLQT